MHVPVVGVRKTFCDLNGDLQCRCGNTHASTWPPHGHFGYEIIRQSGSFCQPRQSRMDAKSGALSSMLECPSTEERRFMDVSVGQSQIAQGIAQALIEGFDKHYRLFRESSAGAKARFEAADWAAVQVAVRERIPFYDDRVKETVERLRSELRAESLDHAIWQQAKLLYMGLLINHKRPELAETFFNSVSCKILHRTYFNNDFIFFRPAISTEYIETDPPTYRSYYPTWAGLRDTFRRLVLDFGWQRPFEDLDRDSGYAIAAIERHHGGFPQAEANLQIQVLHSPFYRNKAAYIVGKMINR